MKKIILIFSIAAGVLIPLFSQTKEFYYLSVLAVSGIIFLLLKYRTLTLIDVLILFLITIPFHTFRLGGTEQFIRLSEIAFIPLFLWWVVERLMARQEKPFVIRKEFVWLFAYIIINILSIANSIYPFISIKRTMILAYLFLFTYMVSDIVNKKEKIGFIVKAMIIISGISAVFAILQSIFPKLLFFARIPIGTLWGLTLYRSGAGWHDPNYYALYLGMNAMVTLSYLLSDHKKYSLLKIFFVLQILGIIVTFSRTVFISSILVSIYLLAHFGRKKAVLIALSSVVMILVIVASYVGVLYKKAPFISAVVYRVVDKEKLEERPYLIMGHRYLAFKANWAMFLDHPFLGVGPFMAIYNFSKYSPAGYNYPLDTLASHNQYLQLLAEKGIFGFIVFLGFIFLIILKINNCMNSTNDAQIKTSLIAFKSAIFLYLIASFALETSHELQFWLTVGLSIALFNITARDRINA